MDLPRILLIGKNGQVGWELSRALAPLGRLCCVDYPEIDLADGASIERWVRESAPDVIINAAAYTAVDKAESDAARAFALNATGPGLLAAQALSRRALLIHYSTDYVFDGAKTEPYVEEDAPNPLGVYGQSKLAGDRAIEQSGCDHLIFRLCWVYGSRGANFMLTIQRLARERERLRVVSDQTGCPTSSRLIAEATSLALRQVLLSGERAACRGTYHLAASGRASWHQFAEAIVARMPAESRKCRAVEAIPTSEYPTPARRPASSALCTGRLERVFGLRLPGWEEGLNLVTDTFP